MVDHWHVMYARSLCSASSNISVARGVRVFLNEASYDTSEANKKTPRVAMLLDVISCP